MFRMNQQHLPEPNSFTALIVTGTLISLVCIQNVGRPLMAGVVDDAAPSIKTFQQKNDPSNLKSLFKLLHKAAHAEGNRESAGSLFASLIPDESRLRVALKPTVDEELAASILGDYAKWELDKPAIRRRALTGIARAEQTEVQVHQATTEEILAYHPGSAAYAEFPGGTKDLAASILRSKTKFYEVEFLEPGEQSGMKYHLFYWDGKQWSMLGPIWRILD